jgi:hypothetical protein
MRLSLVLHFTLGVLPFALCLSHKRLSISADDESKEEVSPTLQILQNVLTAISTDVKALDKAILAAKTTLDVPYILRNITKLDQTINLSTKTVAPADNITADLAMTLQSFGGQLTTQVLTTLNDLVGSRDLIASVTNGTEGVSAGLTAVITATMGFVKQTQDKVPASVWVSSGASLVQNVMVAFNDGIAAFSSS